MHPRASTWRVLSWRCGWDAARLVSPETPLLVRIIHPYPRAGKVPCRSIRLGPNGHVHDHSEAHVHPCARKGWEGQVGWSQIDIRAQCVGYS
eukprot:scaffold370_cov349-Pavlova_lutheri.AAC.27